MADPIIEAINAMMNDEFGLEVQPFIKDNPLARAGYDPNVTSVTNKLPPDVAGVYNHGTDRIEISTDTDPAYPQASTYAHEFGHRGAREFEKQGGQFPVIDQQGVPEFVNSDEEFILRMIDHINTGAPTFGRDTVNIVNQRMPLLEALQASVQRKLGK